MALDFFAGCVGGCAGVAVGYPLDTVKVRLQTQDPKNPTYRGTFHCLRTIVQQESVRGLFKGMSSPLASVAVINAMIFGVYGNVHRRLSDPNSLGSHALAGSVAGLVQSFVCSPMELVKTRIQVQEHMCSNGVQLYKGPWDCVRQIWQTEGTRGIFRGLNITIAREIPAFGIYFSSYEAMTRQTDSSKPIGTFHMMFAGGMAGIYSWLFTYPIDFLKSRLQVDGLAGFRAYNGIRDCIAKTYRDEGINGFFRGMGSTLIRSFPVNAVTFSVVTWILRWAAPYENKESSVTYQSETAVVQESLAATATFAQDHQVPGWASEWQHEPLAAGTAHLAILVNTVGAFPMRNYVTMQCRDLVDAFTQPAADNRIAQYNEAPLSEGQQSALQMTDLLRTCDCRRASSVQVVVPTADERNLSAVLCAACCCPVS